MPFGSFFAAVVLAFFGAWRGGVLAATAEGPSRVFGLSIALLSLTVAVGLFARREWARWLGVAAGVVLTVWGAVAFDVLPLLAGGLSAVLLALPPTGRPDAPVERARPSALNRALAGVACLAIGGCVAATAWAVARIPMTPRESAAASKAPGASLPARAGWVDFSQGIAEAKSTKKLMLVDFYATWCNPCKIMEKRTLRDPRVEERLKDLVTVRVDSEEEEPRGGLKGIDLAERYAIESYPTIVVIDGDGKEVARNVGVLEAEPFLAWLDAVIERASTTVARR